MSYIIKTMKKFINMKGGVMSDFFDIHSHILPGIDDGARSLEDTKKILHLAYSQGIRHIIATPHFREERFMSTLDEISLAFQEVEQLIISEGLDINLYLGQEIYFTSNTAPLLLEGEILTMADSNYVLLEFSPRTEYGYIKSGLQSVIMSGFWPILAHFERYDNLVSDWNHIDEIVNMGVGIQLNASTVTGSVFSKHTRLARKLLKYDIVDFIATDTHNYDSRGPKLNDCVIYIEKKHGKDRVNRLLYENPMKLINNEGI